MRMYSAITFGLAVFLHCSPTNAQENGGVRLTFAYPTSVGLLWPNSKTCALRPELAGAVRSGEATITSGTSETSPSGSSDSRSLGAGVSALFYVRQWDALRAYLTRRFAYTRSTTTRDTADNVTSGYLVAGSFGFEHALGRRFGLFAELGVGYDRQRGSNKSSLLGTITTIESTATTVGPRSGIGAIFRFQERERSPGMVLALHVG
jgi:hypothetical protein